MLQGMTAFARQEEYSNWGIVVWELRSVNHRYLETSVRLPDTVKSIEPIIRERILAALSRGKVECSLKLQITSASLPAIQLDLNRILVKNLLDIASEVEKIIKKDSILQLGEILRWPGIVNEIESDLQEIKFIIMDCFDHALEDLVAARKREGQRTTDLLKQRCTAIHVQVQKIRQQRDEVKIRWRDKLLNKLADISIDLDHNRLEQELVITANKLDIEEELDRLDAHLDEIQTVLQRQGPVGRRLDFLMQELNREANTLSSKANDMDTTRATIEIKVLIEQMREQIQNIE